jgi:hypothetical protein
MKMSQYNFIIKESKGNVKVNTKGKEDKGSKDFCIMEVIYSEL